MPQTPAAPAAHPSANPVQAYSLLYLHNSGFDIHPAVNLHGAELEKWIESHLDADFQKNFAELRALSAEETKARQELEEIMAGYMARISIKHKVNK